MVLDQLENDPFRIVIKRGRISKLNRTVNSLVFSGYSYFLGKERRNVARRACTYGARLLRDERAGKLHDVGEKREKKEKEIQSKPTNRES